MGDSAFVKRESLVAIADAIREVTGKTQLLTLDEIQDALKAGRSVSSVKDIVERNITSIVIPDGITSIGYYAFYNYTSLTNITIPNSVTSIKANAFGNCTSLASITIPGSVTSINSQAFYQCTNLKTINVPWAKGAVANAPWGATKATINYNYTNS